MTAIFLRFQALKMWTTGQDNPGFGYEKLENPESAYLSQPGWSAFPLQHGGSAYPLQPGGSAYPSQPGGSAYPLQLSGSAYLSQPGGGYAPPQGQYAQVGDGEGRSGKGGG
jgi:hypothetical protein